LSKSSRRSNPPTKPRATSAAQSPLARYRSLIIFGTLGLGALVIAFVLLQSNSGEAWACDSQLTPPPQASTDPTALGFETAYLGNSHVFPGTKIVYPFCAPTSGSHYSSPGRGPVRNDVYGPEAEQAPGGWVHNLEHGAIVVLYRCPSGILGSGDCATQQDMALMRQWWDGAPVVNNCPKQAIVARFDEMSTPFAVLAWNRALLLDEFDLDLASEFASQWTDVTAPEPNNC
jgi:Protein of unknown function (DUF3105)